MTKQAKKPATYRLQYPVLAAIGKLLLNLVITSMLLGLGFWLAFASTMGPTYLPEVRNGALDMWIRFAMLGTGATIWLVTPIWFLYSIVRYIYKRYKNYQTYKNSELIDKAS